MSTKVGDIFVRANLNDAPFQRGLASMSKSATKVGNSIGRKLSLALGGIGLGAFIKKATDAGASLNAMGTIIDASLPHMTQQVDEFAKSAGQAFGLSETQAKGFVGKFASMAHAMGYTEKQAYDMSTALTALAGDVASYYHISADEAYAKLGAVFTGETESLKQLGVVMTQSALDQFALQQGMGKTTAQMSELEKTTLRYQFVLDRLNLASGDFAKYATTWSGSIATIKLNWSNFMATVGQGLINILLPLLQVIAKVSNALTALGQRFLAFTRALTGKGKGLGAIGDLAHRVLGKTTQKGLKNTSTAMQGVGNSAKGIGGGAKKAKKEVQKLKRELLGFDKITKLTKQDSATGTSGGSGVSGGGGGGGIGDLGSIDDALFGSTELSSGTADKIAEKWARQLKKAWAKGDFSWFGEQLGKKVNKALGKIDWDKIQDNLFKAVDSLTSFFNGAVKGIDWKLVGQTMQKALLTFSDTVVRFVEDLDSEALGEAFADWIAGALTIDWEHYDWEKYFKRLLFQPMLIFKIFKFIIGLAKGLWKNLKTALPKVFGKMDEVAFAIGDFVIRTAKKVFSVKWWREKVIKPIKDRLFKANDKKQWEGTGKSPIQGLLDGIKNALPNVITWVRGIPKKIKTAIGKIDLPSPKIKLSDNLSGALDSIKKKWDGFSLKDKSGKISLGGGLSTSLDNLKKKWDGFSLKSKTAKFTLKFVDKLQTGYDTIAKKIQDARKKYPATKLILPNIHPLAEGGYVKANTPQLAMIGDNKREGEIVAPESKLRAMAQEVASSGNADMIRLLTAILSAIQAQDNNVYLDGEQIKNNVVRRINNHTRATGQLELLI